MFFSKKGDHISQQLLMIGIIKEWKNLKPTLIFLCIFDCFNIYSALDAFSFNKLVADVKLPLVVNSIPRLLPLVWTSQAF